MAQIKKILFGSKPEWEQALRKSVNRTCFDLTMANLTEADTQGFDAIVPLNLSDHTWLENHGRGLPAVTVPRPVRTLCHDKLALNQRLIELGFGDNIPKLRNCLPEDPCSTPVIVKSRSGAWGKGVSLVLAQPQSDELSASLAAGTHFVQDYIAGRHECATHILMRHGEARMIQTIEYDMGPLPHVKGHAQSSLHRRWLSETIARDLLLAMLRAIGFTDGTCCLDYRLVEGGVMLFEINPRFGGSLSSNVSPYLEAYLDCIKGAPQGRLANLSA